MDKGTTRPGSMQVLSLLVLFGVLVASLGAFFVSRRLVEDQERHVLVERTGEVAALLSNSIDSVESFLRVLGPIGADPDAAGQGLFQRSAAPLVEGGTTSIGVAVEGPEGFEVVAAVGHGPEVGEVLSGERAALASRAVALEEPELVSTLFQDDSGGTLVLARAVPGTNAVAYRDSAEDPSQPASSTPESPFRAMRVALYASPDADPDRLLVTTESEVPLPGRVEQLPFVVGADQWLLVVGTHDSVVGSFARTAPWLFLAGGVLTAILAAVTVETLGRRRAYALALVAERTRDLEQALGELGQTRTFLEQLVTSGPVLVSRARTSDQEVTYVSPNVERLFGLTEQEVSAPGFLASRTHPDDLASFGAAMERLASGASSQEVLEYRFRFGDSEDSFRWISATITPETVSPETGGDGPVTAVLAYVMDIDDRRRAEHARAEAQAAAEGANQAKSEFLSRMSHELRTPLNAVLGFGQLLEIEDLTGSQRDAVEHILKGGHHLLDLINEVLDISRVEAGELSLSPEPVHVGELVGETVSLIRPLADERGIQLVVDRSGGCDSYMFADRQRVKQVLLNLLANAVKYNRPRGSVAVSCQQADMRVQVAVTDTGMGIPAERLGQLFTPFERLGAENTGEEGTGIGLALSRRLAEAMGGRIDPTSTTGQGSTFTLDLPLVEGPVERHERLDHVGELPAPAPHRRVVLHVEDNLSNLTLVERVLAQRADIEVIAAMQGRLGLELAREHQPVLVLLDLHLPDVDGEQVLHRLRDDPATASIPVVIVSADATSGQIRRLLAAGASAYITKPIDVRELLKHLDDAIENQ